MGSLVAEVAVDGPNLADCGPDRLNQTLYMGQQLNVQNEPTTNDASYRKMVLARPIVCTPRPIMVTVKTISGTVFAQGLLEWSRWISIGR